MSRRISSHPNGRVHGFAQSSKNPTAGEDERAAFLNVVLETGYITVTMQDAETNEPILWTVRELAKQLHIKPSTLYLWAMQGKIPALKIHGLVRFRREAVEQWMASFEQTASPRPTRPLRPIQYHELDSLIAAAKREVYTPRRGKTRPKSCPITKEEMGGAV